MRAVFVSYAFPPQAAPRAVQVSRLAQYSALSIRVLCADRPDTAEARVLLRPGVEVLRFPDFSPPWWRRLKHLLYLPDAERPWAERLARTVLADGLVERSDILVTFGQPMSDHLAGLRVKRVLGVPWIVHFSDPWSDNPYLRRDPLSRWLLRRMEREVIATADRVVFTSNETLDLVMRKYPPNWRQRTSVLPHACEPGTGSELASARQRDAPLILRHLGNFYGPRNPLLLAQAVKLLQTQRPDVLRNVRIELIGRWVGREGWSPGGSETDEPVLVCRPPVPYKESLRLMQSADALLIIDAPFECNVFFPSKLVDYLGARRPILALTPPGTSANIVAAAGGVVAAPNSAATIAAGLSDLIERLRHNTIGPPAEEVVAQFDARRVGQMFDRLVEETVSAAAPAVAVKRR